LLMKKKILERRMLFVCVTAFLPAAALAVRGVHMSRVSAFSIFTAAIVTAVLLEQLFKNRKNTALGMLRG